MREAASPAGAGYQRHVGVNADMRRVAPEAKGASGRVALLRKALRAQNRLKIEKKCAGVHAVWEFICMFAVLNLFSTRAVKLS